MLPELCSFIRLKQTFYCYLSCVRSLDQSQLMTKVSGYLQAAFPVCGDLLLGATKIRRVPLAQVTVPKGARITIGNNVHAGKPSSVKKMRERLDVLLDKQFGYDLFTFNCEHFATYVRYGQAVCNQVGILAILLWNSLSKPIDKI